MFKDYDKYLSQSLKVYLFVLIIIFIMKLVGLDYFGLDVNNEGIIFIDNLMKNPIIKNIVFFSMIMIYQYLMIGMVSNKNIIKPTLYSIPFTFIFNGYIKPNIPFAYITTIIEILCLFLLFCIINGIDKNKIKNFFKMFLLTFLLQAISKITRYNSTPYYINSISINILLNLDYMIMMIISYKIYKLKGEMTLCQIFQVEVGSYLPKKQRLLNLLTKLQKNLHNFKKLDKETKLTYIIYFILSLFWNVLTIIIVLLVAKLNHTLVECLFILTSFWLSKKTFGKAFHLSSMAQCFIVSNLTYYTLNRITTPLGISIVIPIMLGVGLSYVTSKLVKKTYKPLYKGMSKELFEETILKVVDKDSVKYKICYDYFINKKSALYLSGKYNYTEAGIRKIKDRINNKIKELN